MSESNTLFPIIFFFSALSSALVISRMFWLISLFLLFVCYYVLCLPGGSYRIIEGSVFETYDLVNLFPSATDPSTLVPGKVRSAHSNQSSERLKFVMRRSLSDAQSVHGARACCSLYIEWRVCCLSFSCVCVCCFPFSYLALHSQFPYLSRCVIPRSR